MKISLITLKIISLILVVFSFWIYTTEAGLHFILLYFSSGAILILGIIFLLITIFKSVPKFQQLFFCFLISSVLVSFPIVIGNSQDKMTILLGIISLIIAFVVLLFGIRYILKE